MRKTSFEGRLTALVLALVLVASLLAFFLGRSIADWRLGVSIVLAVVVPLAIVVMHLYLASVNELIRTLSDAVSSLRDGDFSIGVVRKREDELGELVDLYNEVGGVLREERRDLFQRELLLDTVIQSSPVALVLLGPTDAVVYSNSSARHLLLGGRRLEGLRLLQVLEEAPQALAEALASGRDGLYSLTDEEGQQRVYHVSQAGFVLQARQHRLFLLKHLTRELSRQEVATWKKVIRVISHELNNSLAPIASLAHSGRQLSQGEHAERLQLIFSTIEERAGHLERFVGGYSRFAKLPEPRAREVSWDAFLETLRRALPFQITGEAPRRPSYFDPSQIEQVLINLLKNAAEAGSPPASTQVSMHWQGNEQCLTVSDRGTGMEEQVLENALLPFYSTKRSGTGLGLALCREIVEAHGGHLGLHNRSRGGLRVEIRLPGRDTREETERLGSSPSAPERG